MFKGNKMSEEKFTKGELVVDGAFIKTAEGFDIAEVAGGITTIEEDEANVLLFSQANAMYQELVELRAFFLGMAEVTEGTQLMVINHKILNIDERLAKARGE